MAERKVKTEYATSGEVPTLNDLAVVVDSLHVKAPEIVNLIRRIIKTTSEEGLNTKVLVAMHSNLDPVNTDAVSKALKKEFPSIAQSVIVDKFTFAYAYLRGLQEAINHSNKVIEIDSGGGHLPEQITSFIKALDSSDMVFSTRFAQSGKNTYPMQRQIVSRAASIFAKLAYGSILSDTSSGFRGYRSNVIREVFNIHPPDEWVSVVYGPFHLVQDEMAAIISLFFDKHSHTERPITYGEEKKGQTLPIPYLLKALAGDIRIVKKRSEIKNKLLKTQ